LDLPEEDWVLVEGESKGHPCFMTVNDGLKYFGGKSEFDYCLVVTIKLENVQGHRLPTDDEAVILNQMEDIVIEELSKVSIPLEVGRETFYGEREILIYLPKLNHFKSIINLLSQKLNSIRSTQLELHHDPSWNKAARYHGSQSNV